MLTLLFITRKYIARLSAISESVSNTPVPSAENPPLSLEPVLWTEPHLAKALTDLRSIIERAASGHSLGPLLKLLKNTLNDVLSAPGNAQVETRALFADTGDWLHKALTQDGYVSSQPGTRSAESLYDRLYTFLTTKDLDGRPASPVARDAQALLAQADFLMQAFQADKSSNRLLTALDALSSDITLFTARAASTAPRAGARAAARYRAELIRDALSWLVPRLLRAAGALPMPRVEYTSGPLDAAIDALLLTAPRQRNRAFGASASLLPDSVSVQNWSEVRLDVVRTDENGVVLASPLQGTSVVPRGLGGVTTTTRVKITVDGLRVSAHDVGYYVCYRYWGWLGYEDEGLVSLDVGREDRAGEGIRLVLDLEFDAETSFGPNEDRIASREVQPLFRVLDVQADVPGLRFALDRSKHWILNKLLLQPLVAPAGRAVVRLLVASQIKAILEQAAHTLGEAKRNADANADERGSETEWIDWWTAFAAQRGDSSQQPQVNGDQANIHEDEEDEHAPLIETHTVPTTKGIVRTTISQPEPDAASPPQPDTTKIAVGVGAQILPGKGGPHDLHGQVETERPQDVAREALEEVQEGVEEVEERVEDVVDEAARVREEVDQAQVRGTVRTRVEAKRAGWRSAAFDL